MHTNALRHASKFFSTYLRRNIERCLVLGHTVSTLMIALGEQEAESESH